MNVWTVGHSTHAFDVFADLLGEHGIELLADIRSVPKSRRHPHFHTDSLAASLPGRGVAYMHMPALGGWRRPAPESLNGAWRNKSFRGYADYAMSDDFAVALEELRGHAGRRRMAMMCSEALWWRCHRRLVADRLVALGESVWHIGGDGRASAHRLPDFARVESDRRVSYPAASGGG